MQRVSSNASPANSTGACPVSASFTLPGDRLADADIARPPPRRASLGTSGPVVIHTRAAPAEPERQWKDVAPTLERLESERPRVERDGTHVNIGMRPLDAAETADVNWAIDHPAQVPAEHRRALLHVTRRLPGQEQRATYARLLRALPRVDIGWARALCMTVPLLPGLADFWMHFHVLMAPADQDAKAFAMAHLLEKAPSMPVQKEVDELMQRIAVAGFLVYPRAISHFQSVQAGGTPMPIPQWMQALRQQLRDGWRAGAVALVREHTPLLPPIAAIVVDLVMQAPHAWRLWAQPGDIVDRDLLTPERPHDILLQLDADRPWWPQAERAFTGREQPRAGDFPQIESRALRKQVARGVATTRTQAIKEGTDMVRCLDTLGWVEQACPGAARPYKTAAAVLQHFASKDEGAEEPEDEAGRADELGALEWLRGQRELVRHDDPQRLMHVVDALRGMPAAGVGPLIEAVFHAVPAIRGGQPAQLRDALFTEAERVATQGLVPPFLFHARVLASAAPQNVRRHALQRARQGIAQMPDEFRMKTLLTRRFDQLEARLEEER